ncbi:protein FAM47E-like [Eublepharis macularius]|uniref:Protein FAM47E-like n=1 Tax=Eublepharis macularius TaxID=481883 RepID=A0AA97JVR9_EUBMA|nr:protein FAM47E-like [Eublepharis macularius]
MPFQCFQKHTLNKARLSDSLNSQRWRFLRSGLDDFRVGLPPPSNDIIIQPTKGPTPILLRTKSEGLRKTRRRTKKMSLVSKSCHSQLSPMLQAGKETVAQTEYCLSQHPLALYPHLAESIPLELFQEIVGILDPEMLPLSEEEAANMQQQCPGLPVIHSQSEGEGNRRAKCNKPYKDKDPKGKDPYTWFSKQAVAAREREARLNYIPPLDESVKQATKELCRWFDSLGGERDKIDEATIINLFDVGYEANRLVSFPIHVVELNDLPADLRRHLGMPPAQDPVNIPAVPQGSRLKESYQPKWEKIRYGAWYLDPKTWKKQKANEPLEDPQLEDMSVKTSKKILDEKDAEIMHLHGTHAFKEFLERKGYRIPEFLQQMLAVQNALGPKTRGKGSRNKFQRHKDLQENSLSKTANE